MVTNGAIPCGWASVTTEASLSSRLSHPAYPINHHQYLLFLFDLSHTSLTIMITMFFEYCPTQPTPSITISIPPSSFSFLLLSYVFHWSLASQLPPYQQILNNISFCLSRTGVIYETSRAVTVDSTPSDLGNSSTLFFQFLRFHLKCYLQLLKHLKREKHVTLRRHKMWHFSMTTLIIAPLHRHQRNALFLVKKSCCRIKEDAGSRHVTNSCFQTGPPTISSIDVLHDLFFNHQTS